MTAKMNADHVDGAQVLSMEELTQVRGGQEEVALLPVLGGWLAGQVIDYAYDSFSASSNTVTHAPYTDSYSQAIDAANQAQTQQEMTAQMDQMSGQGDQGGYPDNGGYWQYGGGYGG